MRIAIVSKSGPEGGGASMVATQLSTLLSRQQGIDAVHWTGEEISTAGRRSLFENSFDKALFKTSRYASRKIGYSDFFNILRIPDQKSTEDYDIFHCHDLSGVISPSYLKTLDARSPVIWTFHDCSPFTGGCIHPLDCASYTSGCGNCPELSRWPLLSNIDRTAAMRKWRHSIVNRHVSAVICPSKWIAKEAEKLGIHGELINIIPNSIDKNTFKNRDKKTVRAEIGLPMDGFVLFLGSADFNNPYKGMQQAFQAISSLESNFHVLMVGKALPSHNLPKGPTYHFRDFTSDRIELAQYYSACDLSLLPSLAENFPLMLLESMSCGTPAVAFATGGIPEIIEHDFNGWLSPTGDVNGLVAGLRKALLSESAIQEWSRNARSTILERYTEDKFSQSHIELYEKVVAARRPL